MRFLGFLLVLAALSVGYSDASFARTSSGWGWGSENWRTADFTPYFANDKIGQRSLWDDDAWTPEAWIIDAGDEKRVMRSLYAAGILTDQSKDRDNIPVLEVGETFIQLSGVDQRRVLQFVDYVFEITTSVENGMFFVTYQPQKGEQLGVYTKHGFQTY